MKKQPTVTPPAPQPTPTRPEIPEEQLPILTGANRILWGRMGGAVVACTLFCIAAVLFESCL